MVFGFVLAVHSLNDELLQWEPVLEGLDVTFISTTSHNHRSLAGPRSDVRFDLLALPVELNLSQAMLVGLIRKLSFSDVVTSHSVNLPPYRIVNDLGRYSFGVILVSTELVLS